MVKLNFQVSEDMSRGLSELVRRGVFHSVAEALRYGARHTLKEYLPGVLNKEPTQGG